MKTILRVRFVLVAIGLVLGLAALVVTAYGVGRTLAQPLVIRTSFKTVDQHVVLPRLRICGNPLVGVEDVLASYERSGDFWNTGSSVIHTMRTTNSSGGQESSALVVAENVELYSLDQFFTTRVARPPNTHPNGSINRTHAFADVLFRLETPLTQVEWTREPALPGAPRRCFDIDASLLPNSVVDGRRELMFSYLEFPPTCNVTALEEDCIGLELVQCWGMYCWNRWSFSIDDAFLLLDDVKVSLQKNHFTSVTMEMERFVDIENVERNRVTPSVSASEYNFGVYGTFHALYNPKGYNANTSTREEFFQSLNKAPPGMDFYGVTLTWGSNIVTLLREESAIDPWFLIGSIVGMVAIVAGDVYMTFLVVVVWKDTTRAKRRAKKESLENQFESSKKPLVVSAKQKHQIK